MSAQASSREKRTELFVGLFVTFGLVLLGVLILQFGRLETFFSKRYQLTVMFANTRALVKGAQVKLAGAPIGFVSAEPLINDELTAIKVPLDIYSKYSIPAGAAFEIETSGLLGDAYISVEPPENTSGEKIKAGAVIQGSSKDILGDVQAAARVISEKSILALEDIRKALADLSGAIGKIDEVILAKKNTQSFSQTLENLNSAMRKLDGNVLEEGNLDNLKGTLANLNSASGKLDQQLDRLAGVFDQAEGAFAKVGPGIDQLQETAASFDETAKEITVTAQKLQKTADAATETLGQANSGEGLFAALMNDPELKNDFINLIANLRERGILRYKDLSERQSSNQNTLFRSSRDGATPRSQGEEKRPKAFWRRGP